MADPIRQLELKSQTKALKMKTITFNNKVKQKWIDIAEIKQTGNVFCSVLLGEKLDITDIVLQIFTKI